MNFYNLIPQVQTHHIDDVEKSLKLPIVIKILGIAILLMSFFGIKAILNYNYYLAIVEFVTVIILTSLFFSIRKSQNPSLALMIIPLMFGFFFAYLFSTGAGNNSGHLWSLLFPPVVMYLIGSNPALIASLLFALITLILYITGATIDYSLEFIFRYYGTFVSMTVMSYFIEDIRTRMQKRIFDKNNELSEIVDQLEKKDLELKDSVQHYKTLFESSGDAVFILDRLNVIDCNPAASNIFRCSLESLIKKNFTEFFNPEPLSDLNEVLEKHFSSVSAGKQIIFNEQFKRCGGEVFLAEVKLNKMNLAGKERFLCNIRDITDQRNAETALIAAKEKAENSEKMKSDFLARMSHEIRTPINTILNYSSLLKNEFEDKLSNEFEGSFDSINNAANRLLRTIDMILNISEIESGSYTPQLEKIDLIKQVINPLINEFKHEALNKNLLLTFENKADGCNFVTADSYSVSQLLANLIHNSLKYTLSGGVTIRLIEETGNKKIEVEDTGIGIAEEYIPKLFEKFSQEEEGYTRKFEGSGLGLALVKQYCDVNNAFINVSSKKNTGTKFTITFSN
ncbi:MAG: PAS domain S-box protein [Ignavibacteriae bacterium]|nr:PAS domain S-box protein [Ignavibacteriota bacterium]NOG99224.1 PAS domain S-box protein [Ignavibacteriota bacterium]